MQHTIWVAAWRPLVAVATLCLAMAYLAPGVDLPWPSFRREVWAAFAVIALWVVAVCLSALGRLRWRVPLAAWPLIALAVTPWLQWLSGRLDFAGDAWLVSAYLLLAAAAFVVGASLDEAGRRIACNTVASLWVACGLVSVAVAGGQWSRLVPASGLLSPDLLLSGGRPSAQMGQPNLLCLLLLLAGVGTAYLWEMRRLSAVGALLIAAALVCGVVLTQSRVAWLVLPAMALVFWHWYCQGTRLRGPALAAGVAALLAIAGALVLPYVNAALGVDGATLQDRASAGRRPAAWGLFLHAAIEQPWLGWGWAGHGRAQWTLAPEHASLGWWFSSAHNIVLDLAVWLGLPAAALVASAAGLALWRLVRTASGPAGRMSALALLGCTLHALVELPLHYGQFLWPCALLAGLSLERPTGVPRRFVFGPLIVAAAGVGVVLQIMSDYAEAEAVRPTLRIEVATGHLRLHADPPAPKLLLLDQLQAFHEFAAYNPVAGKAGEGPAPQALTEAALRFPFASSLERRAEQFMAAGNLESGLLWLGRSCRFTGEAACESAEASWELRRQRSTWLPPWPKPNP